MFFLLLKKLLITLELEKTYVIGILEEFEVIEFLTSCFPQI